MSNAQFLPWVVWGMLGTLLLLLLHRIIAQFFPKPPASVIHSTYKAEQPPSEEEGDGMAAVYAMDTALMEAEFDKSGSTFWIYFRQPMAVSSRLFGSLLLSFSIVAWIIGIDKLTCGSILVLLFGLGFSFYPYQTWLISRPTLKEG